MKAIDYSDETMLKPSLQGFHMCCRYGWRSMVGDQACHESSIEIGESGLSGVFSGQCFSAVTNFSISGTWILEIEGSNATGALTWYTIAGTYYGGMADPITGTVSASGDLNAVVDGLPYFPWTGHINILNKSGSGVWSCGAEALGGLGHVTGLGIARFFNPPPRGTYPVARLSDGRILPFSWVVPSITVRSQYGGLNGTPWRRAGRKYGFTN